MVTAAAMEVFAELPVILKRVKIEKMYCFNQQSNLRSKHVLKCRLQATWSFQVHSRRKNSEGSWTLHASGVLQVGGIATPKEKFDVSLREAFEKHSARFDGADFYRLHQERGNQWGPVLPRRQPGVARLGRSTERGGGPLVFRASFPVISFILHFPIV